MIQSVLISGKLHSDSIKQFQNDAQLKVDYRPDLPYDEILKLMKGVHVLVSRSETKVDKKLLDMAPDLKLIARAAVGVGNIDLDEATRRGILVINCPGMNTNSAAELSMGLLLSCMRNIATADASMRQGAWDRHRFTGYELRHKSIGIIGLGNVGHRVARFARGFEMRVLAYDPYIGAKAFQEHNAIQCKSLEELLTQVDVLTVHVPQNEETTGMIGEQELKLLKKGAVVVNAARGGIIEEKALFNALRSGHLWAAGIDTWDNEPKPNAQLIKESRVVSTPHIGASTEEAQQAIGAAVYDQVAKFVRHSIVDFPVNLPGVAVPDHPMIKSYTSLLEKIGALAGQLLEFNPLKIELHCQGELAELDVTLLKLGLMKGYLSQVVDTYVSYVNAPEILEKRGINLDVSRDSGHAHYRSSLRVVISGVNEHELSLEGTVLENQYGRITSLNGYEFELTPSGIFLLIENNDQPGVIGSIGMYLGQAGINIDSFYLSRDKKGGRAMALIKVDTKVQEQQLQGIRALPHIKNARNLFL